MSGTNDTAGSALATRIDALTAAARHAHAAEKMATQARADFLLAVVRARGAGVSWRQIARMAFVAREGHHPDPRELTLETGRVRTLAHRRSQLRRRTTRSSREEFRCARPPRSCGVKP